MASAIGAPRPEQLGTMSGSRADAPSLAIVLVHFHAPAAVRAALAALDRDLEHGGIAAEWCVVDNGSTDDERAELAGLGRRVVAGRGNHGFAAGVNQGFASTAASHVLVLNPDVEVLPGCARALLDELGRGTAAAAPRLWWDHERRYLLPPGEERSRGWEILTLLARRFAGPAARARRRWRRDARRHWEARESLRSTRLSGAALAIARDAWARVGPFDETYRLYFEETDWLLRLEAAGLASRQAAGAEAVHAFAHSTKGEPRAREWFEQSARLFRERRYGRWFARLHDRLARALAPSSGTAASSATQPASAWDQASLSNRLGVAADATLWLELSPNREGFPAAGERVRGGDLASWRPPVALMRASGLDAMGLCAVTASGREIGRWWVDLDAVAPSAAVAQNRSLSPIVR
jgi:GT2 family glycosyltransferase